MIGNPCGTGTCTPTGATTHSCTCPAGYGGDGCVGMHWFYLFLSSILKMGIN